VPSRVYRHASLRRFVPERRGYLLRIAPEFPELQQDMEAHCRQEGEPGSVIQVTLPGSLREVRLDHAAQTRAGRMHPRIGEQPMEPTSQAGRPAAVTGRTGTKTVVTVYPITGKQLFFRVPHSRCRECDLTIRAVGGIEGHEDIELHVKPWRNHLFDALRRGGWHAPVVTIDGNIFSQGIVPDTDALRRALGIDPQEPK